MKRAMVVMLVIAGASLTACVDAPGAGYRPNSGFAYTSPPPPDRNDSPSIHNTSAGTKAALKEGCRSRYGNNERKYQECISGDRHSEDALISGCYKRYDGNPTKLRACLNALP